MKAFVFCVVMTLCTSTNAYSQHNYNIQKRKFLGIELGATIENYEKDIIPWNPDFKSFDYTNPQDPKVQTGVKYYRINRPDMLPSSLDKDLYTHLSSSNIKFTHLLFVEVHSKLIIGVMISMIKTEEEIIEREFQAINQILSKKYHYTISVLDDCKSPDSCKHGPHYSQYRYCVPDKIVGEGYSIIISKAGSYPLFDRNEIIQPSPKITLFYRHQDSFIRASKYSTIATDGF